MDWIPTGRIPLPLLRKVPQTLHQGRFLLFQLAVGTVAAVEFASQVRHLLFPLLLCLNPVVIADGLDVPLETQPPQFLEHLKFLEQGVFLLLDNVELDLNCRDLGIQGWIGTENDGRKKKQY